MRKYFLFLFVLLFSISFVSAGDLKVEYNGFHLYWFGFIPSGINGIVSYDTEILEESATTFQLRAGGGFDSFTTYRESNGSPVFSSTTENTEENYKLDYANFQWDIGVLQDILSVEDSILRGFVYYRGRYNNFLENDNSTNVDWYNSSSSIFNERDSLFETSFLGGIAFNGLVKDGTVVEGIAGEASVEWAPEGMNPVDLGGADFYRINFQAKGFYPFIIKKDIEGNNTFALYTGGFFSFDMAGGDSIPMYVSKSFGGIQLRNGLGGSVRGFEAGTFDSLTKTVINWDLRADFASFYGMTPGVLIFADAGYYKDFYGGSDKNGILASAGLGVHIDFFNFAKLGIRLEFPLYGQRVDASKYNLYIMLGGLHF